MGTVQGASMSSEHTWRGEVFGLVRAGCWVGEGGWGCVRVHSFDTGHVSLSPHIGTPSIQGLRQDCSFLKLVQNHHGLHLCAFGHIIYKTEKEKKRKTEKPMFSPLNECQGYCSGQDVCAPEIHLLDSNL